MAGIYSVLAALVLIAASAICCAMVFAAGAVSGEKPHTRQAMLGTSLLFTCLAVALAVIAGGLI